MQNMNVATRRAWLGQALGVLSVLAAPSLAFAQNRARIVIVGGGVGGATAAKYLKLFNPELSVTVIEKNPVYVRPYGSSEVLNGHVSMEDLTSATTRSGAATASSSSLTPSPASTPRRTSSPRQASRRSATTGSSSRPASS